MPHPLLDLWSTILGLPNLGVYLWIAKKLGAFDAL